MLNKHLLDDESVQFNFEFMAWLIRNFGAPHAPPVPSPLHKTIPLYHRHWSEDDQRSVYVWVEDELTFLKTQCHLQDWHIIAKPLEDHPPYYDGDTPVIAYDPKRCAEPGYFSAEVLIRLSEVLISSKLEAGNLSEDVLHQLKILTICYLGQGLTLEAMPATYLAPLMPGENLTKAATRRVINRALFGTALTLACRRFSIENLIATYGSVMQKKSSKLLWNGMKQVESYDTDMNTLKMLCGKGEQSHVAEDMPMSAAG